MICPWSEDPGECEEVIRKSRPSVRPGMASLPYRLMTHPGFKRAMCEQLQHEPDLAGLTTQDDDDFTIALLDAWSCVGDILTFYQEQIANESYLRTATERFSVVELARLVGCRLGPGVAASTYLSFVVEGKGDIPIATGTQVQSTPGPDEQPQTFETVEALVAREEWNAMKPALTESHMPVIGDREMYLKGSATGVKVGDGILIVGAERTDDVESERWDFRRIASVEPEPANDRTRVTWAKPLGHVTPDVSPAARDLQVFSMPYRAALFAHNSLKWPDGNVTASEFAGGSIPWKHGDRRSEVHLDALYPQAACGTWVVFSSPAYEAELYHVDEALEETLKANAVVGKVSRLLLSGQFRADFTLQGTTVFLQGPRLELSRRPFTGPPGDDAFALAPGMLWPVRGNVIELEKMPVPFRGPRQVVVRGKRIRALVRGVDAMNDPLGDPAPILMEMTRIGDMVRLVRRDPSNDTTIEAEPRNVVLMPPGKDDELTGEAMNVTRVDEGLKTLTLDRPLSGWYDRGTVVIQANVAAASHGETVHEILGNGDASRTFQSFTLRHSPVTYVSAANASGSSSSITIRVNDLLWHEVTSLQDTGPADRVFVSRLGDDGNVTVVFGDGVHGARLPTGQSNVHATYRKGIGKQAELPAGKINLLVTRPLGLKDSLNPVPSTGAADPDDIGQLRDKTSVALLTFDRIVSLTDFEDFARTFAGIGKAKATQIWDGKRQVVVLTVAGAGGTAVLPGTDLHKNLSRAIRDLGLGVRAFQIVSFDRHAFSVHASVTRHPDADPERVLRQIREVLLQTYSFERRAFLESVTASEIIAVIQGVDGVVSVDLDLLDGLDPFDNPIVSAPDACCDGGLRPAVLVVVDPSEIVLSEGPA